jgi:hypothetical protein
MFKASSRTNFILTPALLACCIAPTVVTSAFAADLTNLRPGGRVNTLGALRGASPNALNSALSRHAAPAPTQRGPNVQVAPTGRGAATHRSPTYRTPSTGGSRPSLSGMINRLNSLNRLAAPGRPSGACKPSGFRHQLADPVRVPNARRPDKTYTVSRGGATAAAIRKLAAEKAARADAIEKAASEPTLQEKIAQKIAARAAMEKLTEVQIYDDDDKSGGELPYDEFRERTNSTPSAQNGPALPQVPGLALANLDGFKELGTGAVMQVPGAGRPGGASGLEVMPEWQAPGLVNPEGTPMTQPGNLWGSWLDALRFGPGAEPGASSGTPKGPGGLTVIGTASSQMMGNRSGETKPSDPFSDNRVMDDGGDDVVYDFNNTDAEEDAVNGPATDADGNKSDLTFYLDGSSNSYTHHDDGSVTVWSQDADGDFSQLTSIDADGNASPMKVAPEIGDTSPCVDGSGRGDCNTVSSGGGSSVSGGEATGQPDPSATEGGIVFINGMPVGRLLTTSNRNCQTAKCDAYELFGRNVEFLEAPDPFGLFERVVNPSPRS